MNIEQLGWDTVMTVKELKQVVRTSPIYDKHVEFKFDMGQGFILHGRFNKDQGNLAWNVDKNGQPITSGTIDRVFIDTVRVDVIDDRSDLPAFTREFK